jgi:hypothetical protein
MTTPSRGLPQLVALVCALHALVLWLGLEHRAPSDAPKPHSVAVTTRWIAPPPAVQTNEPVPAQAASKLLPMHGARHLPAVPSVPATPAAAAAPSIETETATALPPAPDAEPVLRADSIQRAVRESARHKSLATLAGDQLGRPDASTQTALQKGVASAGLGDCLKGGDGGYGAQGLGLLALPMLAVDLARGRCAK